MSDQRGDMKPWYLAGGLAVVLVGGIVLIVATQPGGGDVTTSDMKAVAGPPSISAAPVVPPQGVPQRNEAERLRLAAVATLGAQTVTRQDENGFDVKETAKQLVDFPFGPVLLTESEIPDCPHACSGFVSAYYLRETTSGFDIISTHKRAVEGAGGWGVVPDWRIDDRFLPSPAILAISGYATMGTGCGIGNLTVLEESGPRRIASFTLDYDNSASGFEPIHTLEAEIVDIRRGQSFSVQYSGTSSFKETYILSRGSFILSGGPSKVEGC